MTLRHRDRQAGSREHTHTAREDFHRTQDDRMRLQVGNAQNRQPHSSETYGREPGAQGPKGVTPIPHTHTPSHDAPITGLVA